MAFEDYRIIYDDTYQYFLRVKEFLLSAIEEKDQGKELVEGYGIFRTAPNNYEELTSKIDTIKINMMNYSLLLIP
jgi:hypothetical protein